MKKGDIWVVKLPSKFGREQSGTRPGIVIADTKTDLVLIIPLTSNLGALKKLPFTFEIKKSSNNGLEKDSVALIFQIQSLDRKRFLSKIGELDNTEVEIINQAIRKMLSL